MPTQPDDSNLTLDAIEHLRAHPDLVSAAEKALALGTPAAIENLRKLATPALARAALTLARGQLKAREKFGPATTLWGPPEAIEQASSPLAAAHKATRFAALKPHAIADFCCGIGGDTLALAAIAPTLALDLSPIRLRCLELNAAATPQPHPIETLQADLTTLDFSTLRIQNSEFRIQNSAFHIDPSRRAAGRRFHLYADMLPGPVTLAALIAQFPAGAIKLSPAVDFATLPAGHLELLSESGRVTQAVLWTGTLAAPFPPNTRTVTLLRPGHPSFTYTAEPNLLAPPPSVPLAYFYEIDPATHRAGLAPALAAALSLAPLSEDAGYLTSRTLLPHPLLTAFAHLETIPYDEKRLTRLLGTLTGPPGPVEVKTRGGLPLKTDLLQRHFSAATAAACTVVLYRGLSDTVVATVCRRI